MIAMRAPLFGFVLSLMFLSCVQASTTESDRQAIDIRNLVRAAHLYFADCSTYPRTDVDSTWFEKLMTRESIDPADRGGAVQD